MVAYTWTEQKCISNVGINLSLSSFMNRREKTKYSSSDLKDKIYMKNKYTKKQTRASSIVNVHKCPASTSPILNIKI